MSIRSIYWYCTGVLSGILCIKQSSLSSQNVILIIILIAVLLSGFLFLLDKIAEMYLNKEEATKHISHLNIIEPTFKVNNCQVLELVRLYPGLACRTASTKNQIHEYITRAPDDETPIEIHHVSIVNSKFLYISDNDITPNVELS